MARGSVTGRKANKRTARARAPRTVKVCGLKYPLVKGCIEVEGHLLGAEHIEEFKAAADVKLAYALTPSPYTTKPHQPEAWARHAALEEVVSRYKPTKRAEERITTLAYDLSQYAISISALKEFLFWEDCARATGCKALRELITAAEVPLMRLRWLANTMERQGEEKLQDWIAHEEYYHTIGNAPGHQVQS